MKKLFISLTLIIFCRLIFADVISTTKIAKIGNEIILKSDVEKFARRNNVTTDEAKKMLIENAIIYLGAVMYAKEPEAEEIANKIKKDKAYYASINGRDFNNVTDKEFLAFLNYGNVSMSTYQKDIKKMLWMNKFIDDNFNKDETKLYVPTEKEINELIKNEPGSFEEQEGVLMSMIYFSFYDDNGIKNNKKEIDGIYAKSNDCLFEIKKGKNFEELVEKYSNDLISKNNKPAGRIGFLAFDEPKAVSSFSLEIINELKTRNKGVIEKVFKTENGLYIFKIDEKYKPIRLPEDEAKIKAEGILKSRNEDRLREVTKQRLIKMVEAKIPVEYF